MITINFFKKFISKMLLSGIMLIIVCNISCIMAVPFEKLAPLKPNENWLVKTSLANKIRKQQFYINILSMYEKNSILKALNGSICNLKSVKKQLDTHNANCKIAKSELDIKKNEYEKVSKCFNSISIELTEIREEVTLKIQEHEQIALTINKLKGNLEKLSDEYSQIILNCSDESLFSGDIYQKSEKIFEKISKLKDCIAIQTKLKNKTFSNINSLNSKKLELKQSHDKCMESVHSTLQDFEKARNKFNTCSEKLKLAQDGFDSLNKEVICCYGELLIDPIFNYVGQISERDSITIRQISLDLVSKLEFILYIFDSECNSKQEF